MKTFPVLWQGSRALHKQLAELECPQSVPWEFIAECGEACSRYHGQTPQRLAERGGLAPEEILVVLAGPSLSTKERLAMWHLGPEITVPRLKAAVAAWEKGKGADDASHRH